MRLFLALASIGLLSACTLGGAEKHSPINPATLGPLSGREQALLVGAEGAMREGHADAAERDYQLAVAASTGHVDAHVALAKLYALQDQDEKERAILERAREFQPNHPKVNYMLGKLDLSENKNNEAIEHFSQGLKSRPKDLDLLTAKGIAQDMVGLHSAAQLSYQRAIAANGTSDLSGTRTNLAMSYLLTNEPKKAVEVLKDEAKKPGASPVTRHNLALAYGMLGKNTEAKALVHGEMDEETRQLTLARMKEYIHDRANDKMPNPIKPTIKNLNKASTPDNE